MDVAALYSQVIRGVIEGVRGDFSTEQLDEAALRKLATLWEHKVRETHSVNVEYEKSSASEGQSAEIAVRDTLVTDSLNKTMEKSEGDDNIPATASCFEPVPSPKRLRASESEVLSSDSDEEPRGEEFQTPNLVLAQFEKVTRTKNKWKCTLKEGVMTLNCKDTLFGKANGEFICSAAFSSVMQVR